MISLVARGGIGWLLLVAPIQAQTFLWELDGGPPSSVDFGYRVLCLGDLDADGCDDFVVSDPSLNANGVSAAGALYVYSGKSQSLLWSVTGTLTYEALGTSLARLSDIDGDGFDEFVTITERSHTDVYSAKLGTILYSIPLGDQRFAVANAGDLDLDGIDDILIGGGGGSRDAYAYSGKTGANLFVWPRAAGRSVSGAGDVDADGIPDVIIGDPMASTGSGINSGRVLIYSGANGSLLREIDGTATDGWYGAGVRGGHVLDGDGVPDFLVSSDGFHPNYVTAVSGATGGEIIKWPIVGCDDRVAEFAGDIDADGVTDVFVNNGSLTAPSISLMSGRSGVELYKIPGLQGGLSTGDFNGDGLLDVLIGDESASTGGAVFAYTALISPRVASVQPDRLEYRTPSAVTVAGSGFSFGSNMQVLFGATPATNVVVFNDTTITCTAPAGLPGPVTVTVQDNIGAASLEGGFTYTPAVLWDGDPSPGGQVIIHYLCDPLDGIFAIAGANAASIPTPPFDGALGILPFVDLFVLPPGVWPFDHFDFKGDIPNDPSLIGVTALIQTLDGPSFSHNKDATWTNVASITIQ